ncbi:ankyrin repeat domain-containing protein [Fuchsiella alkaliacetigena]|uniref:ankyrin repeat domain-containing protein n=1 Tax=Fuchsiella alkaliacetigena TaxID=957042 RepID=UPI00200A2DD9|nr:ankyrin repeat domain-containing protein [Fuchsiella alkaliacetigena]MCK8826025.1 ankyrin repeat domain-containing protein [Fuchsiella alkaliacetigena]
MKKTVKILALVLALLVVLLGCGNDEKVETTISEEEEAIVEEEASEEEVEIEEEIETDEEESISMEEIDWYSISIAELEEAITKGLDINTSNEAGETPLMKSAAASNLEVVEFLVEEGVEIDAQDEQGKSALIHAAYNGNILIIESLLNHEADATLEDETGVTALKYLENHLDGSKESKEVEVYESLKEATN